MYNAIATLASSSSLLLLLLLILLLFLLLADAVLELELMELPPSRSSDFSL